jgi:chemotaxis-related protein WspD
MSGRDPPEADPAGKLLSRPAPPEYLEAWREALRRPIDARAGERTLPFLVFRVGEELLALDALHVREVHRPARVHRMPGRSNDVFLGIASFRGELVLCASLRALLGIEPAPAPAGERGRDVARMVVVERRGAERWAFRVDEVLGVRREDSAHVLPAQVTVAKSSVHFTNGLVDFGDARAARLDADRLFAGFLRSLS